MKKIGNRLIDGLIFKLLRLDISELKSNKNYYRFFYPVRYVVQSGMLVKFTIAKKLKFNEALFIDQVDREYCSRITKQGFIILENKKILAKHKLGIGVKINNQIIHYEDKKRLHYITRNSAYLLKIHELPAFEYFFVMALFYRKYILVKGFKSIPSLIRLYTYATIEGFMGKLGELETNT